MNKKLTTEDFWRNNWQKTALPVIQKPVRDYESILKKYLPREDSISLIEIGCAPGGWMAWFNKCFGYDVSGIEYVREAACLTERNMKIQGIDAEVLCEDFLEIKIPPRSYDLVFSGGFIEHFDDPGQTLQKIAELSDRYVVTSVPNFHGFNGLLRKIFRPPEVFKGHKRIDSNLLRQLHEQTGLRTIYCDYVGPIRFVMPFPKKSRFYAKHRFCARFVNLPFWFLNRISSALNKFAGLCPRTKLFSESLIYVGQHDHDIR